MLNILLEDGFVNGEGGCSPTLPDPLARVPQSWWHRWRRHQDFHHNKSDILHNKLDIHHNKSDIHYNGWYYMSRNEPFRMTSSHSSPLLAKIAYFKLVRERYNSIGLHPMFIKLDMIDDQPVPTNPNFLPTQISETTLSNRWITQSQG